MAKKLATTPRSQVRAAIRKLWLRSRERAATLKRDEYCCTHCGIKQSRRKDYEQKVEVHHVNAIQQWDKVIDYIYRHILVDPAYLETICPECYKKEHERMKIIEELPF